MANQISSQVVYFKTFGCSTMSEVCMTNLTTTLGQLDASPLATVLLWKECTRADLMMATHDEGIASVS